MPRLPQFRFKPAMPDDAGALAALQTAVAADLTSLHGAGHWSGGISEQGVLQAMGTSRVFVARMGKEMVGTLRLTTKKPWAIDPKYFTAARRPLYLVAVAPAWQRQGIGRRCLEEAVRIAQEWPADAIRLDAYDAKAGGGEFYTRCGWTERGRVSYREVPLIYYEKSWGDHASKSV